MPNEECKTLHLSITCKVGEVPCMSELKKGLKAGICYFVAFASGTDEEIFQYLVNEGNSNNPTSTATEPDQASLPAYGDAICSKADNRNVYGTLGIFAVKDDRSFKNHLAVTCYHVCYNVDNPIPENHSPPNWHEIYAQDSENDESLTRKTVYRYRHKMTHEKNDEQSEEKGGEKFGILGKFHWGVNDKSHDIGFVEVEQDLKCKCTINDIDDQVATREEIGKELEKGELIVEKTGFRTKKTRGILTKSYSHLPIFRNGYLIKSENLDKPFADPGDSGSLVKLVVNNKKKNTVCLLFYVYIAKI